MSGRAVVAQEVYLANGKTIGVSGSLTPPTGKYSAIIRMQNAGDGATVLKGTDEHQLDNNDISKFKLDADSSKTIMISGNTGVIANTSVGVTDGGQTEYYASLADAIAAATGTPQSPAVISLMGSIEVSDSITVDDGKNIKIIPGGDSAGNTVTINRSGSNAGSLFTVGTNASLTLAGSDDAQLVLDGGWDEGPTQTGALVTVDSSGTLTMNDGAVLQNNSTTTNIGGGVHVNGGGTFNMYGGTISGNGTIRGSGVYVAGVGTSNGAFTMYGGSITGNTAPSGGGGVCVSGGSASFTMKGGSISGNTSSGDGGGGVFVHTESNVFTMEDGEISDNTASYGGGVYVGATFNMTGGTISRNRATTTGGGGVYVTGSTFAMSGTAEIKSNTATNGNGGGVYLNRGTFTKTGGTVYGTGAGDNANTVGSGKVGAALYKGASATSSYSTSDDTF
jgi:hypothetical protein